VEVVELDTSLSDGGEPLVSEARGRRSHAHKARLLAGGGQSGKFGNWTKGIS